MAATGNSHYSVKWQEGRANMAKNNNIFSSIMPFGLQNPPGDGRGSSIFYSMGMPGLYNGRWTSVYEDQFNNALRRGQNPNSIMPWGSGKRRKNPKDIPPPEEKPQIQWSFPQYSQSWAFTPPAAPPYIMPPPFDKKQYK
jgi:hypothetical protein